MIAGAAVWLASSARAGRQTWRFWERTLGSLSMGGEGQAALARPETSGLGGNYTITAIDEPNAGTSAGEGTIVFGVNASGEMTGTYSNSVDNLHGFVRAANGTFTSFDAPNAGSSQLGEGFEGTLGFGIDSAGDAVGTYADNKFVFHGFLREAASPNTFTVLDDPNACTNLYGCGTVAMAINDAGQIAGFYTTGVSSITPLRHGFLYDNGSFTTIDAPDAGDGASSGPREGTVVLAINASGEVTGVYIDSSGNDHGFVRSAGGTVTGFDVSGATTYIKQCSPFCGTFPMSMDTAGDVVGSYTDANLIRHGFIRSASGTITTFDAPGANNTQPSGGYGGTFPTSIDPTGSYITGVYTDSSGLNYGFVYSQPLSGNAAFTTFRAPNASATPVALPLAGTGGFSVNASGTAVGGYMDSGSVMHGFAYTASAPPSFGAGSGGTTSMTVTPGATTGNTGTVSVVGQNGFSGTVNLTCAVTTSMTSVSDMPTCSLNPTSVGISGASAQTSTLTVVTTATSSAMNGRQRLFGPVTGGTALAMIAAFLVPRRRRNWLAMSSLFGLVLSISVVGCGGGGSTTGGGNSGTTPGSYTVTVTGTSGTSSATVGTIALTVE